MTDAQTALDNIVVGRAHNSEHRQSGSLSPSLLRLTPSLLLAEMDLINILAAKFAEEDCYRLLVSSISSPICCV